MRRNPNTVGKKICPHCEQTKTNEQFIRYLSGPKAGQLYDWCKACTSEYKNSRIRKRCTKCKQFKYLTQFYRVKSGKRVNTYYSACKVCHNLMQAESRKRNSVSFELTV